MNKNAYVDKIQSFLKKNNYKGIIVLFGPTGCGKTGLSIQISKYLQAEGYSPFIISTDSRQIYTRLDIGTGKITQKEMSGIRHYGIDIIQPNEIFSVVNFRDYVESLDIWKQWKKGDTKYVPIVCGGTGLYIDSLVFERNYMGGEPNLKRRQELEKIKENQGDEALWQILHDIDPKYASELHPKNTRHIIRGIEIFEETGKSKLESKSDLQLKYPTLFMTPYNDSQRPKLYQKINKRIETMFEEGLVEEVQLLMNNYPKNTPGLQTIGYKEVVDYLEGNISKKQAIELIQQHNRNYAKRQISWNKKYLPFLKK